MLKENIKNLRKSKGLSQEELAVKLHVVRQTVSKWENGLSVPDAAELISLAEELDTPVGVLLGETVPENDFAALDALSAFAKTPVPAPLDALRAREERFKTVVEKDEMRESVRNWLVK